MPWAAARWVPVAVRLPPAQAANAGPGSHRIEFVIERLVPPVPSGASLARDGSTPATEPVLGRPLVEKSAFVVPR